ncbi:MAG: AEC family transporter [Clostridia bacterium]|nr:AEC family transporter [Clostridia bacterium]
MGLFLQNMGTAAMQVFILYIIVAAGFTADKLRVFTEKTARASNDLLFYIVTPCVIINSFLTTNFSKATASGFAVAIFCSVIAHAAGIFLAAPLFNKKDDSNSAVFKFACVYGNLGYMALPLANAVLGETGVFYCSGGVIVFNTLAFTHGIWLMNKGKKEVKFKIKSLILNPGVISVAIGLPLFLFSVKLPSVIQQPISFIAGMNTPLAMLFFGTYLANTDLKTMFKVKEQYLIMLVRLIGVPVLIMGVSKILSLNETLTTACMISAAVPSANNTVMFSAKYGKDTALASKIVALNSFVSIITLPIMIALSQI